ncbi:hypothetical protein VC83_00363 [Pseudogymnoascus destructans]|nr:uncharacterized protein VC83_00363 [Pseudogymnoascus destructans]OAF62830.1 hypothetical protein VC83_00363 [Pseudogymnoascus destructans]
MRTGKALDNSAASRASIIMKVGACVGGTILGYLSQFVGRRRTIIASALISMVLIPTWILPNREGSLSASGFFMQFFVQGAWGVIPIHLNELSPPAFRSSFPGLTYQLGNTISSPSAQIVNALSEKMNITGIKGGQVPAYGPVMGVATTIIAMGIVLSFRRNSRPISLSGWKGHGNGRRQPSMKTGQLGTLPSHAFQGIQRA